MKEKKQIEVEIINELGMHARAAASFVQEASKFNSEIFVEKDGLEVNGKSIMGVLMLVAPKGSKILIKANGDDADEALEALSNLIKNRFGEDK
ncbi:HPr family phosphocarrier protein [Deferribacter autotrophicus]|uniref:HPr family phosphocarrier protein n=1 Tax=Deferribacter autotrophicus TaxID=500465 RepID=A0A5A8F641_9BACT|nr:HPr family phosphocarrier protein [Deferribacter autotrophicus]KAA0258204.1 HPr family phosphocarrier protein [Deferribacter autotrophicus]